MQSFVTGSQKMIYCTTTGLELLLNTNSQAQNLIDHYLSPYTKLKVFAFHPQNRVKNLLPVTNRVNNAAQLHRNLFILMFLDGENTTVLVSL